MFDWFGDDGKIKLSYRLDYKIRPHELYFNQMMSNVRVITPDDADFAFRVYHVFRPFYKSRMRKCFFEHEDKILDNITQFRDYKNNNCYIYNYYDYVNGLCEKNDLSHHYAAVSDIGDCIQSVQNLKYATIVINDDVDVIPNNVYQDLLRAFRQHFSQQSKYEREVVGEIATYTEDVPVSKTYYSAQTKQREKMQRLIKIFKNYHYKKK